jgi:hypothetical protein
MMMRLLTVQIVSIAVLMLGHFLAILKNRVFGSR